MEFLIVVGVVGYIIYRIVNSNSGGSTNPVQTAKSLSDANPFSVKIVKEQLELEGGGFIDAISIKVKGIINSGEHLYKNDRAFIGSMLLSVTEADDKEAPVLCAIEELQHDDTPVFSHVSDHLSATYGLAGGWDEWVSVVSVPIAALTFSHSGSLRIKVHLKVFFQLSNARVERVASLNFYNQDKGYLETAEDRKRAKEIAVSLAVLVSGVDGSHDNHEAEIIKDFIKKQLTGLKDEKEKNETKKSLNDAVIRTHAIKDASLIKRSGLALAREAKDFESSLKFMIMELLLDVAGADSVAEQEETKFLNSLAHTMGMDVDEYKNMRDKALPITMYAGNSEGSSEQVEDMLGLKPDMSVEEKKSQLSKEFRKWNPLQNSSDPEKSKQAKEMVNAISKLRKEL